MREKLRFGWKSVLQYHGPIFWERQVIYVYLCSCHFDEHETEFKALCNKVGPVVNRLCLVDSPINYPFLTDEFYHFILISFPNLQWIYLREIDLEPISWATVQAWATHPMLKRIIVHWCRNYDALANFQTLKQLLVVNQQIKGLKYLEEIDEHLRKILWKQHFFPILLTIWRIFFSFCAVKIFCDLSLKKKFTAVFWNFF